MGTNFRGWQLANFFSFGSTALASNTWLIVEYGVIDKDSGPSTGLEIVVRALHGSLISFHVWVVRG